MTYLKPILLAGILFFSMALGYYEYQQLPGITRVDTASVKTLPARTWTTVSGEPLILHDIQQPTVLIHFWASWCKACLKELPSLLRLAQQYPHEMALVLISLDETPQAVIEIQKNQGQKTPLPTAPTLYWLLDSQNGSPAMILFKTLGVPETFIFNADRALVKHQIGALDWQTFYPDHTQSISFN
jgi:thiol-disulfide isomerase/thioredoxin